MVSLLEHPMLVPESSLPRCYLLGPWFEEIAKQVRKLPQNARADDFDARNAASSELWNSEVSSQFLIPLSFSGMEIPPGVRLDRLFGRDGVGRIVTTLKDHTLFEAGSLPMAMTLTLNFGGEIAADRIHDRVRIDFGWKLDGRGQVRISVRGNPTIDAVLDHGLFTEMELSKEPLAKAIENIGLWQHGESSLGRAAITRQREELTVQISSIESQDVRSLRECVARMSERSGRDPVLATAGVGRIFDPSTYGRADAFLDVLDRSSPVCDSVLVAPVCQCAARCTMGAGS